MKMYFYEVNGSKQGPFTFQELKEKKISNHTLIWHSELENWTQASKIEELKEILINEPPPLPRQMEFVSVNGMKKKHIKSLKFSLLLALVLSILFVVYLCNSDLETGSNRIYLSDSEKSNIGLWGFKFFWFTYPIFFVVIFLFNIIRNYVVKSIDEEYPVNSTKSNNKESEEFGTNEGLAILVIVFVLIWLVYYIVDKHS
jgi:uncharacterized BrkB/YihY/UPF0761 family membrane protein